MTNHGRAESENDLSIAAGELQAFLSILVQDIKSNPLSLDLIAEFIKSKARIDTLKVLVDRELQAKLETAISRTLETKFYVPADWSNPPREISPWSEGKGHTVVVIDESGNLSGVVSVPTEGLEGYGDLTPYALTKAVFSFVLDSTKWKKGQNLDLGNPNNHARLTTEGHTLVYNGASRQPAKFKDKIYYIGSSGCAANPAYLKELLGGAEPTHDTQAGRFDAIFSDLVGNYLLHGQQSFRIEEPQELKELRFNN